MRHIDDDTITQAVIARHAAAVDPRLREVMTSLVQHLHAFARETRLTEGEWRAGLRFLADCGAASRASGRDEFALLSDALGLSTLVAAQQRRPAGCTDATLVTPCTPGAQAPSVRVQGRVCATDGAPVAGATLSHGAGHATSNADGGFAFTVTAVDEGATIPGDGPVGRLLAALGRTPRRPAHIAVKIDAPGCEPLTTQLFRRGDRDLDGDAAFGVRGSLVADWVPHERGGAGTAAYTLDFDFVLNAKTSLRQGDRP
ncbi:MAG TPA: dioxygenase [Burkholderiaceae bacterium]|nr:dioxygenase [Burkholderiaceae bacterium]